MPAENQSRLSWLEFVLPLLLGGIVLGLTYIGWIYTTDITNTASTVRFENRTDQIADVLKRRFDIYENILYDARGFYASSDFVSRDEWKTYIQNVGIGSRNIGLTSLIVLKRVPQENVDSFVMEVRDEVVSSGSASVQSYSIFPKKDADDYFPVVYIEPQSSTSAQIFGFDHSSNPIRKEALDKARDMGSPQISETTQSITNRQNVFLMYIPLYSDKVTPQDVFQRRENLIGYISAGFANANIFPSLIAESNNSNLFTIRFFDGNKVDEDKLLYQQVVEFPANTVLQTRTQQVIIAGQTWTIQSEAPVGFGLASNERFSPMGTVIVGSTIGLLVTVCSYLLISARKRALNLAQKIAQDLQASSEQYRTMFESLQDVLYRTDLAGNITMVSPSIEKYTGFKPEQLIGRSAIDFYLDAKQREIMVQQLMQNGNLTDYQIQLRGKDNQPIEVSLNARVIFDETKKPAGIEGVLRDVTTRTQAENTLRKQTEELERSNQTMVDRELKMIELKKENEELRAQLSSIKPSS